eukprot:1389040-Amorphochlora_amoeboformis.AAC.2
MCTSTRLQLLQLYNLRNCTNPNRGARNCVPHRRHEMYASIQAVPYELGIESRFEIPSSLAFKP